MPKIYSDIKRQEITELLLDTGLELIKQFGIKKLNIEAITRKVGIAQGTYYNFFASKEMLVYALAERYKKEVNEYTKSVITAKGYLEREDLRTLYMRMFLEDNNNIFRYLSRDDMQIFLTRLPKEYFYKITDTRAEIERNLSAVKARKNDCDIDAIINWIQVLNLTIQNKDLLVEAGLEKIIDTLIENMLNEIFEQE